jgi:hypothetical protein
MDRAVVTARRSSLLGSSMPVSGGSLIDEKNYSIERSHAESGP